MQFTDLFFLFAFLPVALCIYYLVSAEYRTIVLLAISVFFYSLGSPEYVVVIVVATLVNIVASRWIIKLRKSEHKRVDTIRKILQVIIIAINISFLGVFKYSTELIAPIGISFYVFKSISYICDCYSGKVENFDFMMAANYLFFFPQVSSGPISRYRTFTDGYSFDKEKFCSGTVRFMIGMSKKILLADVLYKITSEVFSSTSLSTSLCWLGSIAFSLQLYYDFSGYSDMAIGLGNMFGFETEENFNFPYCTRTISEFWRRWHMTLGSFFREYVYFPLGGSRKGTVRTIINLLIVWLLTGIWHGNGLTFIVWGLLYFTFISLEKVLKIEKLLDHKVIGIVYRFFTLLLINALWVIFNSNSMKIAICFLKNMVVWHTDSIVDLRAKFLFEDYFVVMLAALFFAMPIERIVEKKCAKNAVAQKSFHIIEGCIVAVMFVVALAFIVNGYNSPFIYANF